MAIESDLVRADAIDLGEFPELADRYQVLSVPVTIVNETLRIEGPIPEGKLIAEVLKQFEG